MSGIGAAIIGGSAITGLLSANAQKSAAQTAANAQLEANQQALAAQKANYAQGVAAQDKALASGTAAAGTQNNSLQALLAPYVAAGTPGIAGLQNYATGGQGAFTAQQNLAGANGNPAQLSAVEGIRNSPYFQQLLAQGVDTANQNASANGNLRSGNGVAAVAQLSPQLLNQVLQQQFTNLGSLSSQGSAASNALASLGAGSAGTQAQGTQQTLASLLGLTGNVAGNVAGLSGANTQATTGLLGQQGQIGATNALAQGQADASLFGGIGNSISLASLLRSGALGRTGAGGGGSLASAPTVEQLLGTGEGASLSSALARPAFGNITGNIQGGNSLGDLVGTWRF